MKLLLDENLSRRIVPFIQSSYPGSTQVALIDLQQVDDRVIRQYAIDFGYIITTRDADFYEMSLIHGHPPKLFGSRWVINPKRRLSKLCWIISKSLNKD